MHKVLLSQLPHTGFDYGLTINGLYWVFLLFWSFFLSYHLLNSNVIRRLLSVNYEDKHKYNNKQNHINNEDIGNVMAANSDFDVRSGVKTTINEIAKNAEVKIKQNKYNYTPEEYVKELVKKELGVSRVDGVMPTEFEEDDFSTVDFDGINPDDNWTPHVKPHINKNMDFIKPLADEEKKTARYVDKNTKSEDGDIIEQDSVEKHYKDLISISTEDDGTPRLVLNRRVI